MAPYGRESDRPKIVVVMPAYNAAKTLKITYEAIPHQATHQVILVDDGSTDKTLEIARELCLTAFVHTRNYGYGANQKTCYTEALKEGADIVVMLHPDYQYDPTLLPEVVARSRPVSAILSWAHASCQVCSQNVVLQRSFHRDHSFYREPRAIAAAGDDRDSASKVR